jgi:hypothetical protein
MTTEERRAAAPYLYHSSVKWIQKETAEQTPAHNAANPTVPKMLTLGAELGRWGGNSMVAPPEIEDGDAESASTFSITF